MSWIITPLTILLLIALNTTHGLYTPRWLSRIEGRIFCCQLQAAINSASIIAMHTYRTTTLQLQDNHWVLLLEDKVLYQLPNPRYGTISFNGFGTPNDILAITPHGTTYNNGHFCYLNSNAQVLYKVIINNFARSYVQQITT